MPAAARRLHELPPGPIVPFVGAVSGQPASLQAPRDCGDDHSAEHDRSSQETGVEEAFDQVGEVAVGASIDETAPCGAA